MIKKRTDYIKLERFLTPLNEETRKYLQAISDQYNSVIKHIFGSGMNQTLVRVLDQQREMAQRIADSLFPTTKSRHNWLNEHLASLQELQKVLQDNVKQYSIAEKRAAHILRRYKWFICPSMPTAAIKAILTIAQKKGRKDCDINKLFINYFAQDNWKILEQMVYGWRNNVLFKKRLPIFMNCVKVLQNSGKNKYNGATVVLPTLISQIDGILTDYLYKYNISSSQRYDVKKIEFRKKASKEWPSELGELSLEIFLDILFQKAWPGKPLKTPFNFNRHKIMHGESLRFGRKDYVVRAFMVLDFLAFLKQ